MTLTRRLLFYFGGFGIGMILLFFFLGGKRASCDYGPNARTLKNIRQKQQIISENIVYSLQRHNLDTSTIGFLLNNGNVNFQSSNTSLDSCKVYLIEGEYKEYQLELSVENCNRSARFKEIKITPLSY